MNFRQNWGVLALYTLLTATFTYPVVLHLNSRIMGDGACLALLLEHVEDAFFLVPVGSTRSVPITSISRPVSVLICTPGTFR